VPLACLLFTMNKLPVIRRISTVDQLSMINFRKLLRTRLYDFVKMTPGQISFVSNAPTDQIGESVFPFSVFTVPAALQSLFEFCQLVEVSLVYKPLIFQLSTVTAFSGRRLFFYDAVESKTSVVIAPNVLFLNHHSNTYYSNTYSSVG